LVDRKRKILRRSKSQGGRKRKRQGVNGERGELGRCLSCYRAGRRRTAKLRVE